MDIKKVFSRDKKVSIIPASETIKDSLPAAIALCDTLQSNGSKVDILYDGAIPQELSEYAHGVNITGKAPEKELVISVSYDDKPFEEVNYSVDNGRLNLILKPVSDKIDLSKIESSISGGRYDTLITIGINDLESAAAFTNNKEVFTGAKVVNLDISKSNKNFGDINIVNDSANSLANLILFVLGKWEMIPSKKAGEILLKSIKY